MAAEQERRPHGTGTIRLRPDGRYEATLRLGRGPDGRLRRRSVYGKTEAEIKRRLRELTRAAARGEVREQAPRVDDYLRFWLRDVAAVKTLPYVAKQYAGALEAHVIPALGRLRLDALTPVQLQQLYAELGRRGLAASYVRHIHGVLHAALRYAVDADLLLRNPADRARPPSVKVVAHPTWTGAEARRFLAAITGDGEEPAYWLALTTGLRVGEILGLRWEAVDFARSAIQLGRAKTPAGRRWVPICPPLRLRLWERHRAQGQPAEGYVFATRTGKALSKTAFGRRWRRLRDAHGMRPVVFHDLRHTAASLLIELGFSLQVVQALLGHSSVRITGDVYAHLWPTATREAVEALGDLFSGPLTVTMTVKDAEILSR